MLPVAGNVWMFFTVSTFLMTFRDFMIQSQRPLRSWLLVRRDEIGICLKGTDPLEKNRSHITAAWVCQLSSSHLCSAVTTEADSHRIKYGYEEFGLVMSNVGVNQRSCSLEVKHYVNQLVQFSSSPVVQQLQPWGGNYSRSSVWGMTGGAFLGRGGCFSNMKPRR